MRGNYNMKPDYPQKRNEIGPWLTERGLTGDGVEVGVFEGSYSEVLLRTSQLKTLYLVDIWEQVPTDEYHKPGKPCGRTGEQILNSIMRNFDKLYPGRYRPIRKPSVEASTVFVYGSLDFVYIDADHSYQAVMDDIAAWLPKVKPGGVIAGHDYKCPAVHRAVLDSFRPIGLKPVSTNEPGRSWVVKVPVVL